MSTVTEREKTFYEDYWRVHSGLELVTDPLWVPGIDLRGKRVLICTTGMGVEPVKAARAGAAQVVAFDLAEAAIRNSRDMAAYNGVVAAGVVADFHHLPFPDNTFDVLFGESVLHHVDCALAGREMYRCLKPGGVAFFYENSDRNLLLRFVRRAFGRPGGPQRQRLWFVRRIGSTDEFPLTAAEVGSLSQIFEGRLKILYTYFVFFTLLSRHVWRNHWFDAEMHRLDAWVGRTFPGLRRFGFAQQVWMQKRQTVARAS